MKGQVRGRRKNKAWFSACSWIGALHLPAGNLSQSLTLSAYHRTIITYANSTQREREKEREWAQC